MSYDPIELCFVFRRANSLFLVYEYLVFYEQNTTCGLLSMQQMNTDAR